MIKIGSYNYLKVKEINPEGAVLTDSEEDAFLPVAVMPGDLSTDEEILVFAYFHKDGRIVATTKKPYACVGDFAYLKVVDQTEYGAFLDIGIDKDVFVPSNRQLDKMEVGESYVCYIYLDDSDGKLLATSWLEDKIELEVSDLDFGEEVSLLIFDESEMGFSAIIDNKYMGLLYRDEVYQDLHIGETLTGYIKKIRPEDGKVDLSLRPIGFDFILDSKEGILEVLKENGGVLNLGDKSNPDDIRSQLRMSKKAFKQVIGGLYKERKITISDYEVRLVDEGEDEGEGEGEGGDG